jgi:hypothetical protein
VRNNRTQTEDMALGVLKNDDYMIVLLTKRIPERKHVS